MSLLSESRISVYDLISICIYFALLLFVGIFSSCQNRGSIQGYFLAGKSMVFPLIGASLFASNIGSGHFIGLAGAGASSGIGIAGFEINATFILVLLGWLFLPVYIRANVYTMPEYLRNRFGGQRIGMYLSIVSLMLYIFTKISVDLYSGSIFIIEAAKPYPINLYLSTFLLMAMATVFTVTGGLTAVIWTDFLQTIIMIVGATYLSIVSFLKIGGIWEIKRLFPNAVSNYTILHNTTDGEVPGDYFSLVRSPNSDYPWPGMFIGLTINSIWYWCTDQVIVQRALAAKNLSHAKAGTILAAYLKFLPLFLLVFPGMISRILYPEIVACSDPVQCKKVCGKPGGCTDIAYPQLVLELLPDGMKGIMISVMIASLISSLTSIFNSASTIFTMDIVKRFRPSIKDWQMMIISRIFIIFLFLVSIAWIPVVQTGTNSRLFDYIQNVSSVLAPPICAVFLCAIFIPRTTEPAAFWSLIFGLVVGLFRLIWDITATQVDAKDQVTKYLIFRVHYLHFAIILFGICFMFTLIASLFTTPETRHDLTGLTFWSNERSNDDALDTYRRNANGDVIKKNNKGYENKSYVVDDNLMGSTKLKQQEDEQSLDMNYPPKKRNFCVKMGMWICGIEKLKDSNTSTESMGVDMSVAENRYWRFSNNLNAILLLIFALFITIFFSGIDFGY